MKKQEKITADKTSGKVSSWFSKKIVPQVMKLPNQTHFAALRDGFGLLLPLTIAGSIGTLVVVLIFGGWGGASTSLLGLIAKSAGGIIDNGGGQWAFVEGSVWVTISEIGSNIFGPLKAATIDSFSIYVAFLLPYMIGKIRGLKDPVFAGLVGLGSFIIVTHTDKFFFDASGMLSAIIVTMIAAELFCWMVNSGKFSFKIKGGNIPEAIIKGFDIIIPVFITLLAVGMLDGLSWTVGKFANIDIMVKAQEGDKIVDQVKFAAGTYGFAGLFYQWISAPIFAVASNGTSGLGIAIFYVFMIGIFWIFGIHGSNMMNAVFLPIFLGQVMINQTLMEQGVPLDSDMYNVFTIATFDSFIIISGWGITGALVLGLLIFGNGFLMEKQVAKVAAIPQIFNINEPVTFGLPLMLNFKWAVPAIMTMPIATLITYFAYELKLVDPTIIYGPWTLPLGVNALLSTGMDWKAPILTFINFGVAFCIYLPFIFVYNRLAIKKAKLEGTYELRLLEIKAEKAEKIKLKAEKKALRNT